MDDEDVTTKISDQSQLKTDYRLDMEHAAMCLVRTKMYIHILCKCGFLILLYR